MDLTLQPPRWLASLLGSLCALLAALWLGLLWQHPADGRRADPLTPPILPSTPSGAEVDWAAILAAAPFGAGDPERVSPPQTELPLRLLGVVAKSDPTAGRALIAAGGGASEVYASGAALPGGATLLEIWPSEVILQRAGQRESLALPENALGMNAVPSPAPQNGARPIPAVTPERTTAPSSAIPAAAEASAPTPLSRVMTWQSVLRAGQPSGVRIYPGVDAATFDALGLRPGDLVLAINQAPIADLTGGRDFAALLGSSPILQLGIEREGRVQTLQIDVSQLTSMSPTSP
jgi:type II secretion system protein C